MLRITPERLQGVQSAQAPEQLYQYLQGAIELEHSTIPPYLTALYTLKPNTNQQIASIITSVVREEMLHMTIACNLLTTLGGAPVIDQDSFIPKYPGILPMNVGDGLRVGLQKFSKQLMGQVFMQIEKPEKPVDYPVKAIPMMQFAGAPILSPELDRFPTIGDVYDAIRRKIHEFHAARGDAIFSGNPSHQVVNDQWFSKDELFPIQTLADVDRAITLIITQGEGASGRPTDEEHRLAHYYRFAEIFSGYGLTRDREVSTGWSYSGPIIRFEETDVFDMPDNPKLQRYAEGTRSRFMAEQFTQAYNQLLHVLHLTFNGQPELLSNSLGLMFQLRILAYEVLSTADAQGHATGLCFEYSRVIT